ncbi:MAG: 2-amino-4-hydroxy-6-hydroxymethyldihydropteridine diphosphokinase [Anaerolineales bacterium]
MNDTNPKDEHLALIGIGSNIRPEENIHLAVSHLSQKVHILSCSQVWQNPAIGSDGPDYLNAAIQIQTDMDLKDLKDKVLLPLERELERVRTSDKNADRTIDLDILVFDEQSLDEELWTQAHVSIPCAEILPHFRHPHTKETLEHAAKRLLPEEDFFVRDDLDLCLFSP